MIKKIMNFWQYHLFLWFLLFWAGLFAGNNIFSRLVLRNEIYYTICTYIPIMVYLPKFVLLGVLFVLWWFYTLSTFYSHKTGRKWLLDRWNYRRSYLDLLNKLKTKRSDPEKLLEEELEFLKPWECDGVPFGMVGKNFLAYRKTADKGNIICFGMPGSGKTQALAIPAATQFGKRKPAHILCIDIKGDILEHFSQNQNRKIKKFIPHDEKNHAVLMLFERYEIKILIRKLNFSRIFL